MRARSDIADIADHLVQSARASAEGEQSLLVSGEQILRAVGSLKDVRDVGEDCDGDLADAMIGVDYFNNLSRIDDKGAVVCSAMNCRTFRPSRHRQASRYCCHCRHCWTPAARCRR